MNFYNNENSWINYQFNDLRIDTNFNNIIKKTLLGLNSGEYDYMLCYVIIKSLIKSITINIIMDITIGFQ